MKSLISILATLLLIVGFNSSVANAATGNTSGFAWGGTSSADGAYQGIGWISFSNASDGSATAYGVTIPSIDGSLSGYAWSENYGWLSFTSGDLRGCPSGTCSAHRAGNTLTGWARFLASSGAGGWSGWVSLSGSGYGVAISGSNLSGYAWSDELGWINFSGVTESFSALTASASVTVTVGGPAKPSINLYFSSP